MSHQFHSLIIRSRIYGLIFLYKKYLYDKWLNISMYLKEKWLLHSQEHINCERKTHHRFYLMVFMEFWRGQQDPLCAPLSILPRHSWNFEPMLISGKKRTIIRTSKQSFSCKFGVKCNAPSTYQVHVCIAQRWSCKYLFWHRYINKKAGCRQMPSLACSLH